MKPKLTALILGLFLSSAFFVVFAQTEDIIEEEETSCKLVEEKIEEKIQNYDDNKKEHSLTLELLSLEISSMSNKAAILGYDVSELDKDVAELENLLEDFDTNYSLFIRALTRVKDSACGREDVYARNFITAKDALGDVKKSVRDIIYLYDEEIRDHILNLEKVEDE
jgi:hypothetical protein